MRRYNALALVTSVALAGCGPDSLSGPRESVDVALRASHSPEVGHEAKGTCEVTSTEFVAFNPPILQQVGNAVCQISHLGRVYIRTEQTINVATGAQTGTGAWRTAAGDLLYATSVGSAVPTGPQTFSFTGISTIVGGTGRFTNASGSFDVEGTVDNSTGAGSFTYRGVLAY